MNRGSQKEGFPHYGINWNDGHSWEEATIEICPSYKAPSPDNPLEEERFSYCENCDLHDVLKPFSVLKERVLAGLRNDRKVLASRITEIDRLKKSEVPDHQREKEE